MNAATARTIREALGLSTPRLAALLGLAGERDVQRAEAGKRLVTRRHAELLAGLEAKARAMVAAAIEVTRDESGDRLVVLRYRGSGDMLPGTAPEPFEIHAAVLCALRLRLGDRLAIVEFDATAYDAWRAAATDTQARRAAWAAAAEIADTKAPPSPTVDEKA